MFSDIVRNLRDMQRALNNDFRSPDAFARKIKDSVQDIPTCALIILVQNSNTSALINNIYASLDNDNIARKAKRTYLNLDASIYITNYCYY